MFFFPVVYNASYKRLYTEFSPFYQLTDFKKRRLCMYVYICIQFKFMFRHFKKFSNFDKSFYFLLICMKNIGFGSNLGQILVDLHVLRSPESENHVFSVCLCVCVYCQHNSQKNFSINSGVEIRDRQLGANGTQHASNL